MIASIEPGTRLTKENLAHIKEVVNAEQNPIEYLAIDPGKMNGICGYDAKYYLLFMLVIHADDVVMFINQFEKVKKCIIESYRVFPNKAKQHIYSDLQTPRVIGRVEAWAETNEIELVKQPPTVKDTGYKWIGERPLSKSNPRNHALDAHVHGMFYFVVTGRVKLEDIMRKNK